MERQEAECFFQGKIILTHYQILGVSSNAGFAEIKRGYYRAAKRCHPDLFPGRPEKVEEFRRLVKAFDTLSDPQKRRGYDRTLMSEFELIHSDSWAPGAPLLDSEADDILEELIVGNHVPPETSLATLLADLQKTEIFLRFREGRDHFLHKRYRAAELCFADVLDRAPTNILYHLFYARTLAVRGAYHRAVYHYRCALRIGRSRVPVQPLIRVEAELNALRRKRHPLLSRIFGLFPPPASVFVPDPADVMVAQLSRSLTAAARKALPHDGNRD